jgi:rRNA-processing protein FCF1
MASDRVRGDQSYRVVVLDSSAALMPFEFSIDLEAELKRLLGAILIVVPLSVDKELHLLAARESGERKGRVQAALKFLDRYERAGVEGLSADDAVMMVALKRKGVAVTNDTKLRQRLRDVGVPVVFLRGKQQLALEE